MYNLLPTEIDGFDSLAELALDMRWSWNHATDEVWRQFDPGLWEMTQNPWVVLQTVSRDQIEGGQRLRVMKGAVRTIAEACGLQPPAIEAIEAGVSAPAAKGYRTLAVARGPETGAPALVGLVSLRAAIPFSMRWRNTS